MKSFIIICFLIYGQILFAANSFVVNEVKISCQGQCPDIKSTFYSLKRSYNDYEHFLSIFELYIANEGVKKISYSLQGPYSSLILNIDVEQKPKILHIQGPRFISDDEIEFPAVLPLKEDEYLDTKHIKETKKLLQEMAKEKGYPETEVEISKTYKKRGVELEIKVDLKEPIIINKVQIVTKSKFLKNMLQKKFTSFEGNPYDLSLLKVQVEEFKLLFQEYGYYLIDFNFKYQYVSKKRVNLFLDVINVKRYSFYSEPNKFIDVAILKNELMNSFISGKRELSVESIKSSLNDYLYQEGFYFIKIDVSKKEFLDINQDKNIQYHVKISKGFRIKNIKISFKGNNFFSDEDLLEVYYARAFEQAENDIFDPQYYDSFVNVLREKYISEGFVNVNVEEPIIQLDKAGKKPFVLFRVREGIRAFVSNLTIDIKSDKLRQDLVSSIKVKRTEAFNPIQFKKDLENILNILKEKGYYFAQIVNRFSNDLVRYESDNSQVVIKIVIELGKPLYADNIIIIGNQKTRKRLVLRELDFKSGSLITSKALERSQANLLSLGIFSSVQIKPVTKNQRKTDILIFLREKDFGVIEVAPGVRSDIGFKLSTSVTYNNIDGLNKRISFQGTVNRRFDLNSLDDERRRNSKTLLEYDTSINFSENHIFRSDVDFIMSLSKSRKRFYSFDADIQRISYTFTQDFTNWFQASIRQQLEIISQFEATDPDVEGHFQIGSITPGVIFDFRDQKINPKSGAMFEFSYELATPAFLSQSTETSEINYHKMINRNKFYLPLGDRFVFAVSTAFGIQENRATNVNESGEFDGYIPSIKVFRLSGADIVRGYEDDEINRLSSGEDISDVEVNTRAYMGNLKLEPRYYLSDSTILGLFYDAGRVFVDEFNIEDFRSAVGVTFKYITPVGTLDFDYGIKLLRKRDSSGRLESPGRLHVSIGFF